MISIIIPVYNHAGGLSQVLNSISEQTEVEKEVIIVDDGSTVPVQINTKAYSFSVELYRQENAGAPVARNSGFEKSRGEYVIFWDADIIAEQGMLLSMLNELKQNSSVSFVYGNFYFGNTLMKGKQFSVSELKKNNFIPVCSLMRREDFPGFDPTLKRFQDWDLWLTLAEKNKKGIWLDQVVFRTIQQGRVGISDALPSYAYRFPFRVFPPWKKPVQKYFAAKKIVQEKHRL